MKGSACLLAPRGDAFARTLALELASLFDTVTVTDRREEVPPCRLLLIDLDLPSLSPMATEGLAERRLGYTRRPLAPLPFPVLLRPCPMTEWRRAVLAEDTAATVLYANGRLTLPDGGTVLLTEREAALFSLLYEAGGAPVARDALASAVFPGAAEPEGSLTVYIHYLRKKLERNGKKVILAHRGGGYSLRMESLC